MLHHCYSFLSASLLDSFAYLWLCSVVMMGYCCNPAMEARRALADSIALLSPEASRTPACRSNECSSSCAFIASYGKGRYLHWHYRGPAECFIDELALAAKQDSISIPAGQQRGLISNCFSR